MLSNSCFMRMVKPQSRMKRSIQTLLALKSGSCIICFPNDAIDCRVTCRCFSLCEMTNQQGYILHRNAQPFDLLHVTFSISSYYHHRLFLSVCNLSASSMLHCRICFSSICNWRATILIPSHSACKITFNLKFRSCDLRLAMKKSMLRNGY